MKRIFTLCFIVLHAATIIAQSPSKSLDRDLSSYIDACVANDIERLITLTDSLYVEINGGDSLYREVIKSNSAANLGSGMTKETIRPMEYSSIVESKEQHQLLITVEAVLKVASKRFKSIYQILSTSNNGGMNWKFIDLDNHDEESVKIFIPNLNPDLMIRKKENILAIED